MPSCAGSAADPVRKLRSATQILEKELSMRRMPDLSFVEPDRRKEVLRRISAIEAFVNGFGGRQAAEAHARVLGLRTAQFYNIVRAWQEHGRPERIAGAGHRRQRDLGVTEEQATWMDALIAADPRAAPAAMVDSIMKAGLEAGRDLPRREIVGRYVARVRPPILPEQTKNMADLVVDHTVLEIPIEHGKGSVRPLASALIDTRAEAVVGLALSLGYPGPDTAADAILDALRHGPRYSRVSPSAGLRIALPINGSHSPGWLEAALSSAGYVVHAMPTTARGGGKAIDALLGRRQGGIETRPRLVSAPLAMRGAKETVGLRPMSLDEALDYARPRLVGLRTTAAFSHLDDIVRIRLDAALDQRSEL